MWVLARFLEGGGWLVVIVFLKGKEWELEVFDELFWSPLPKVVPHSSKCFAQFNSNRKFDGRYKALLCENQTHYLAISNFMESLKIQYSKNY